MGPSRHETACGMTMLPRGVCQPQPRSAPPPPLAGGPPPPLICRLDSCVRPVRLRTVHQAQHRNRTREGPLWRGLQLLQQTGTRPRDMHCAIGAGSKKWIVISGARSSELVHCEQTKLTTGHAASLQPQSAPSTVGSPTPLSPDSATDHSHFPPPLTPLRPPLLLPLLRA
jgi:hypothetical protein